jgi:hypothetical protein
MQLKRGLGLFFFTRLLLIRELGMRHIKHAPFHKKRVLKPIKSE